MAYSYAPGRGGAYGENIIEGFGGILQVDGYTGYNRLTKDGRQGAPIELAYCWAHVRRKLYDVAKKNHAPIAEEGPRRIAELYRIEATIKGQSAEARLDARQTRSAPRIKAFEDWLNITAGHRIRAITLGQGAPLYYEVLAGTNPVPQGWPYRVGQ